MQFVAELCMNNIVLTGFMGTGKSTVGRLLARRLEREWVDMDTLIEERQRMSINQIFARYGEPYFRQLEAELCRELAQAQGLVIATGGGALVPEANLQALRQSGLVICFDCDPETVWQRIQLSDNRPLLQQAQDEERFTRLANLLQQRHAAYQRVPYHIEVTHRSPEEVAEIVIGMLDDFSAQRSANL